MSSDSVVSFTKSKFAAALKRIYKSALIEVKMACIDTDVDFDPLDKVDVDDECRMLTERYFREYTYRDFQFPRERRGVVDDGSAITAGDSRTGQKCPLCGSDRTVETLSVYYCKQCSHVVEDTWFGLGGSVFKDGNYDRDRKYGIRAGDIIVPTFGAGEPELFEVTDRHTCDNNRVYLIGADGKEMDMVAEWCGIVCRIEDRRKGDSLQDYLPLVTDELISKIKKTCSRSYISIHDRLAGNV